MKNGVPFDTAFYLMRGGPRGQALAFAYSVIFGTQEGGEFDWSTGTWRREEAP